MKLRFKVNCLFLLSNRQFNHVKTRIPKTGSAAVDDNVLNNFIWGMTNQKPK